MRITEQQVRVGVDYQQQQIQLRQQTTLDSELPVSEIRLNQQSSDYEELSISSLAEGISRDTQPEGKVQQKLDDSALLNRRELAKKAREAADAASTPQTTSTPASSRIRIPLPATSGFGSFIPMTTRRIPASATALAQGPVRP